MNEIVIIKTGDSNERSKAAIPGTSFDLTLEGETTTVTITNNTSFRFDVLNAINSKLNGVKLNDNPLPGFCEIEFINDLANKNIETITSDPTNLKITAGNISSQTIQEGISDSNGTMEEQRLTASRTPTQGSLTIYFPNYESSYEIPWNASALYIKTVYESTISGTVNVTGSWVMGWNIVFTDVGYQSFPTITVQNLADESGSIEAIITQQVEGTSPSSGQPIIFQITFPNATSGTWQLTVDSTQTSPLAYNISVEDLKLELPNSGVDWLIEQNGRTYTLTSVSSGSHSISTTNVDLAIAGFVHIFVKQEGSPELSIIILNKRKNEMEIRELEVEVEAELEFFLADSTNHIEGKTDLTPTVKIRKAGGDFESPDGDVTELEYGWYLLTASTKDLDTLGTLLLHAEGSEADSINKEFKVVKRKPYREQ